MMDREDILAVYGQGPEAVVELVQRLCAQLDEHQQMIASLTERVGELEDRLAKDSHNSSKPPSTDPPKPKPKSSRVKSDRKPGGQEGHPGSTLSAVDHPDHLLVHSPWQCERCGEVLTDIEALDHERRQVVDIPQVQLEVTENTGQDVRDVGGALRRPRQSFPPRRGLL